MLDFPPTYCCHRRIDKNVAMVMAGGPVPRLNGKLWDNVSVEDICKPSGSRIIFPTLSPPVPPPKSMDPNSSPVPSRYDYAPLPSPLQAGSRGADIPKVPSDRVPPSRDRGIDDSPNSPTPAAAGSPLAGSGSRRGEMVTRSASHSPSIAVKPRVSEGGSAVARAPDSLRREALNKSPMKSAREDLPQSLSGTSPSRIGSSGLSAYDSDGGSGGRRDSENDSDDEGGIKSDKLEKASPSDRRRHVVLEILHTERDYVKDLELLLDVCDS